VRGIVCHAARLARTRFTPASIRETGSGNGSGGSASPLLLRSSLFPSLVSVLTGEVEGGDFSASRTLSPRAPRCP
jgi:hypothetical protein